MLYLSSFVVHNKTLFNGSKQFSWGNKVVPTTRGIFHVSMYNTTEKIILLLTQIQGKCVFQKWTLDSNRQEGLH